jgi:ureidoglycolate lyase
VTPIALHPEPLSASAFGPFGNVIESLDRFDVINRGTTQQVADLARIDTAAEDGRTRVSLYRVEPYSLPMKIEMLERHPLSSQLFMPLRGEPFLIVVAAAGERIDPARVRAFASNGRQGVNYHRGTWHHPVIALRESSEFLVIDRAGPGRNCDEFFLSRDALLLHPPLQKS